MLGITAGQDEDTLLTTFHAKPNQFTLCCHFYGMEALCNRYFVIWKLENNQLIYTENFLKSLDNGDKFI